MTTLYRPVLIESAEQAEALDGKVVFLMSLRRTGEVYASCLHEDMAPDSWPERLEKPRRWDWTALVPIEAEEEAEPAPFARLTRYVTPWEET